MERVSPYRLRLTLAELSGAINDFTPRERRDTANFFIEAIKGKQGLFETNPGKITDTEAELWVTDNSLEIRHHISISSEAKGELRYERVDKKGKVLAEFADQKASEEITGVLVDAGALVLVED